MRGAGWRCPDGLARTCTKNALPRGGLPGCAGGALLGATNAVILLTAGSGGGVFALFTLVIAVAFGAFIGLLVGLLNGAGHRGLVPARLYSVPRLASAATA